MRERTTEFMTLYETMSHLCVHYFNPLLLIPYVVLYHNSLRSYHTTFGPAAAAGPTCSKILAPPLGRHAARLIDVAVHAGVHSMWDRRPQLDATRPAGRPALDQAICCRAPSK